MSFILNNLKKYTLKTATIKKITFYFNKVKLSLFINIIIRLNVSFIINKLAFYNKNFKPL